MIARLLMILFALGGSSAPISAADWSRYIDPRSGIAVDIPAGFLADAGATPMIDGAKHYRSGDGRSRIAIWSERAEGDDFAIRLAGRIDTEQSRGWSINYRSITPDWAAWSGTRSGMVVYEKSLATCDGRQVANVRLIYPALDIPAFDAIANRLGTSLGQDGGCF